VVDELEQRPGSHAQALSLVLFALVGENAGQCSLTVRVNVQCARRRKHGQGACNGLQFGWVHAASAGDAGTEQSGTCSVHGLLSEHSLVGRDGGAVSVEPVIRDGDGP